MIVAGLVMALVARHRRRRHRRRQRRAPAPGAPSPGRRHARLAGRHRRDAARSRSADPLRDAHRRRWRSLPVFFMEGEAGRSSRRWRSPTCSRSWPRCMVAVTVTPALSLLLLGKASLSAPESPVAGWLRALRPRSRPRIVTRAAARDRRRRRRARPGRARRRCRSWTRRCCRRFKERDLLDPLEAAPGTSLPGMTRSRRRWSRLRGAARGRQRRRPRRPAVNVGPGRRRQRRRGVGQPRSRRRLRRRPSPPIESVVDGYPGLSSDVADLLAAAITDVLGPRRGPVVVRVYGQDLEVLSAKAEEIRALIAGIDGAENARSSILLRSRPSRSRSTRPRPRRRHQARRRPARRDDPGLGHHVGQPVRGAEGLRGRGLGRARDPPQREPTSRTC